MPFYLCKLDLQKKDKQFGQSSKSKVVSLTKMHQISKNWGSVFYFQYKVAIGQCAHGHELILALFFYYIKTALRYIEMHFYLLNFSKPAMPTMNCIKLWKPDLPLTPLYHGKSILLVWQTRLGKQVIQLTHTLLRLFGFFENLKP